jgi:hypothetical protein
MKARLFAIALSVIALGLSTALTINAQGAPPTWTQVNLDGFGDASNGRTYSLASFNGQLYVVFKNGLYIGTINNATGGEIWLYKPRSAILYVAPSGNCGGATPCYATIQSAVDAAGDLDWIKVAAGTFTGVSAREGVTQVVYIDQAVTVQGGYTLTNWVTPDPEANRTTLDAQGLGRVLYVIGGRGTVIDGLHITGGNAFGLPGGHLPTDIDGSSGGGVYVHGARDPFGAAFTLANNHIYGNTARQGGGVYMSFCCENAPLRGNTFASNSAAQDGGGLLLHAGVAALTDNVFDSNSADRGGGLWADHNGSILLGNSFVSNTAHTAGGGLFLFMNMSDAKLNETYIVSNTAGRGGGLAVTGGDAGWGRSATLIDTVIADNQASVEGSGIYVVAAYSVQLLHTTLARNGGGDGSGVRIGDFVLQNAGPSTVALTNTILVSQSTGIGVAGGSTVAVNGILWYSDPVTVSQSPAAVVAMQNTHWGNPAFVNPDGGDYHIKPGSAAIDQGTPAHVSTDIDGEPRINTPDLGADEYWAPGALRRVYLPIAARW